MAHKKAYYLGQFDSEYEAAATHFMAKAIRHRTSTASIPVVSDKEIELALMVLAGARYI